MRDHTHWMESRTGFMSKVDEHLIDIANLATIPEFQKCMCCIFDEVKVREDLVYDKHLFKINGFVDVGNINNRLLELERSERGEQHQSVATNILMLMVCGFFSDLQFLQADIILP